MEVPVRMRALAGTALAVLLAAPAARAQTSVGPDSAYAEAAGALERFIIREMAAKRLPALSIALVDDQRTVWARGFGLARPADSVPATAETVYRVGSVSKLFTDIGIMQLAERGRVDLDAPVTRYLPDFSPRNPTEKSITLRQLMAHRSGLVREPPVGNYFDASGPTLEATVRSLDGRDLVHEPGSRTKYSNAGIAVAGHVLERVRGEPFAAALKSAVLEPIGMRRSAFEPTPELRRDLADAYMWTYDGRVFMAPTFALGMAPAGSMYSTVLDLGRFLSALFAGEPAPAGRVLREESIHEMWTPQYAEPDATSGFGLGFGISRFDGRRRVGHGGAIYGFATELAALPDEKLGAVVVTTMDGANAVANRIAEEALRFMLAARASMPLPALRSTTPVPAEMAARLAGRYGRGGWTIELLVRDGELFIAPGPAGMRVAVRMLGRSMVVDDRLAFGFAVRAINDRIIIGPDTFTRLPDSPPAPAPDRWAGLIGEYGWDHNTLFILEKDRRLHALIEWFFLYPLEELDVATYRFPDWGIYQGERVVFDLDDDGRATRVEAAGIAFPRRAVGPEDGATFTIDPVRPVSELRADALAASPPEEQGELREPDLVEIISLDPTIELDIRYATTNNFMGDVFYAEPRAFLQRPAAEALVRVHERLREHGYALLIHDAYRPWYVTKMFWDATPERFKDFVADPARGSRHNRGAAVDLTLYRLDTGEPVRMIGGYDEFSPRAFPDYPGGTAIQRWQRELLRRAMEAEGFDVYPFEWWHFDYHDWRSYPILNVTFDRVRPAPRP